MAELIRDFEIIKFGKYKSKNIHEVMKDDIDYCQWVYRQPWISSHPEIKELLENRFKNDGNTYLSFGKYKNKSLDYILNEKKDYKYIKWLKDSDYVKENLKSLKKELDKINITLN